MSRMLQDVELQEFLKCFQHTPAGRRYRLAWNAQVGAVAKLRELRKTQGFAEHDGLTAHAAERDRLQQEYIKSCEVTIIAADVLRELYQWPPDSGVDHTYRWRPSKKDRRAGERRKTR